MEQKPSIGRIVVYNHPGGRYGVMVYQDAPGVVEPFAVNGFEGEIWTPDSTLARHPISFGKGQPVRLDFRRGRFLLGRRTT